jgi:hypothetical protein
MMLVVVPPLTLSLSVSFRNAGQLLALHFADTGQLVAISSLETTRVLICAPGAGLERDGRRPSALSSAIIAVGFVRLGRGRNGEKKCGHKERVRDPFHLDSFLGSDCGVH